MGEGLRLISTVERRMMGRKIITIVLLILFSGMRAPLLSLTIDTTLIGNNSPGPYTLSWHFVDTSSIVVTFADSAAGEAPPFVYIERVNGLLFSEPIDSGKVLKVHYTTQFFGLQKTYSLFNKNYIDLKDTTYLKKALDKQYTSPFSDENLDISGYKSIGISLGSQGQMNLEQALEVTIFGKIREDTKLSANLSDQGTSLEGDTREIGEIDRMYVALENPRYTVVAGDQYVSMLDGGLIEGYKKIKGLSAAYTGKQFQGAGYGAISGGKYTMQNIRGQLGFQGPYYLTGQGEADIITPIKGTVKVIVDGRKLKEGENADYIIDYDIASIRFMPTFPIDDNTFVQVYYEYKAFDYQRVFLGSNLGFFNSDSTIYSKGVIWCETDNKENPIELEFDEVTIQSLKEAGDNPPLIRNGRVVHPNDVYDFNAKYRLYKLAIDSIVKDTHYVFTPYNSSNYTDNKGYYTVWFNHVSDGTGDYKRFSMQDSLLISSLDSIQIALLDTARYESDPRGPVYIYVGAGKGDFSSLSSARAPRRTVGGEITASIKPTDWFSFSTNVAGEEEDKNLFSKKDDKNNTAAASKTSVRLGRKVYNTQSAWLEGGHIFSSKRFSRELISQFDRKNVWNREFTQTLGKELNAWHMTTGATFIPDFSADISYGQFFQEGTLLTHRIGYDTRMAFWKHLELDYSGKFIQHFDSLEMERFRGDDLNAVFNYKHLNWGLHFKDEWQSYLEKEDGGNIGGGLNVLLKPLSFSESVSFSQYRKGGPSIFLPNNEASRDTGSIFIWKQGINHAPIKGWKLSGSSSYHLQKKKTEDNRESENSVLLINASNSVTSAKVGFSTNQQYRLNSEKASAYDLIYQFVGKGLGTHSYVDSLGDFRPDPHYGTHIATEKEVFSVTGKESVRKSTFMGNWYFKPHSSKIKGMFSEISWQGSFLLDEHILLDSALKAEGKFPINTWVPGYSSLAKKNDSLITFADIFYRQDVTWRPAKVKGLLINFYTRPFLRKIRRYDESGVEYGSKIDRNIDKWFFGVEGRVHTLNRFDKFSIDSTIIKDRFVTLKQRYNFTPFLSLFTNETVGGAERGKEHGPYFRLQPGLTLQLKKRGWSELSYTWSQVDIDGQIEYPMAQGFQAGTSHIIDFIIDIIVGEHFSIGGNYRGDFNSKVDDKMQHVVSMEVKAFL